MHTRSPSGIMPMGKVLARRFSLGRMRRIDGTIPYTIDLKEGVVLRVTNTLVDGDSAAVEMESLSTALNGKPFDNRYCWVVHFSEGTIVEVRAYLDSALVQRLIDENESSASQQEQKSR